MRGQLALAAALLLACAGCGGPADKKWTTGATPPATKQKDAPAAKTLTVDELDKLLRDKVACVVLDARNPDPQWQNGQRVPGAKPLYFMEGADTIQEVAGPDKNKLIIVYCGDINCPASARLARRLATLGYTNVKELPEGIAGWLKAGKPVESGTK